MSILPPAPDKRSKELEGLVAEWRILRGSVHFQHRAVDPATAIRVMDALTDGARADGAVDMLVAYDSPLPLLTVSRQTELVSDAHWEEWSSRHVSGLDDAKEFFRYCMDAPGLEETPAFRHAVSVFVHAS